MLTQSNGVEDGQLLREPRWPTCSPDDRAPGAAPAAGRAGLPAARHLSHPGRLQALGGHPRLQRGTLDPRSRPPRAGGADPQGNHHRRRLQHGRHARPSCKRAGSRATTSASSTSRTTRARARPCATASRHATGDVVLVQDADLEYDPAEYPRLIQPILDGPGRRGLRLALHRRQPSRAVLLALRRQQGADAAVEHVHQPEPDRHGDLLQGLPPRGAAGHHSSSRTASASSRRSRPRSPASASPSWRIYEVPISYSRPHLRGRQEDRPQGRLQRVLSASCGSGISIEAQRVHDALAKRRWRGELIKAMPICA